MFISQIEKPVIVKELGNFKTLSETVFIRRDETLRQVMREKLEREPTPEDAKDFHLIKIQDQDKEFVVYKEETLGYLTMEIKYQNPEACYRAEIVTSFHHEPNSWLDEKIKENKERQAKAQKKHQEEQDKLWNEVYKTINSEAIDFNPEYYRLPIHLGVQQDIINKLKDAGYILSKKENNG